MISEYRRVAVYPGKHGQGDYRVTFNGAAPSHSEVAALLHWICLAEDRYAGPGRLGREMLRLHLNRVFFQDAPIETILRDIDGAEAAA